MHPDERESLILAQLPYARTHAAMVFQRIKGRVAFDDLLFAGTLGLCKAVDSFDPTRGVSLRTHASKRIRGEILDYLRQIDPVGRAYRQRIKAGTAEPIKFVDVDRIAWRIEAPPQALDRGILISELMRTLDARERFVINQFLADSQPSETGKALGLRSDGVWHIRNTAILKMRAACA
jgi:RNA polymerase sigma factor for flagellar operon FliA